MRCNISGRIGIIHICRGWDRTGRGDVVPAADETDPEGDEGGYICLDMREVIG